MEQFIRDIQIDLIMDNPNPIIESFNGIWKDLSVIETDVYHNDGGEFIFYNSKNEWNFFMDNKNEKFWCHYDRYWRIYEWDFNLKYGDIRNLTKVLVENALNNTITSPINDNYHAVEIIQNVLNNSISTPSYAGGQFTTTVEIVLNNIK